MRRLCEDARNLHGKNPGFENDYSLSVGERGVEIRSVPLYAAHCLGENCVKYNL